jgi:hypothetical protein
LACTSAALAASCVWPQWFNVTQSCETCAMYTECPSRVLCVTNINATGSIDPIVTATVACKTYTNGTGTCGSGTGCTGGTLVTPPSVTVIIPRQLCPPPCSSRPVED